MLYDNQCYLCIKFAKIINFFAKGKITIVGHYSDLGSIIREEILDESALEMFWFIDKKNAFGGRAALIPLLRALFTKNTKKTRPLSMDDKCGKECKTVKAVFFRSTSLLSNSKKIEIK